MTGQEVAYSSKFKAIWAKASSMIELLKLKLSMLVAISSVFGYAMAAGAQFDWVGALVIGFCGLIITGASNGLNQIQERDTDALMARTANRPMPEQRLTISEALVFSVLVAIAGVFMLGWYFNLPTALLGIIGLLSYAFVYTPLKRYTPFAVFIGAIPGGLPPLIGWVAFTGALDIEGWLLFAFQFFWQFPHFWAIAWRLDTDYQKAGFRLLPSATGKSRLSATFILMYALILIPMAVFPWKIGMTEGWAAWVIAGLGLFYSLPAMALYRNQDDKHALRLMFASFLYLPAIQLFFILG